MRPVVTTNPQIHSLHSVHQIHEDILHRKQQNVHQYILQSETSLSDRFYRKFWLRESDTVTEQSQGVLTASFLTLS